MTILKHISKNTSTSLNSVVVPHKTTSSGANSSIEDAVTTPPSLNSQIRYHAIDCLIATTLFFLGALTTSGFELKAVLFSIIAGLSVGLLKFRDYWVSAEQDLSKMQLFFL